MDKPPIIGVVWEDAHKQSGELASHEIDHSPYVFTSVGWLIKSDGEGVSLSFELGQDGKFRDVTFIPRKMIVKEFPISPKTRKAKKPPS